MADITPVAAGIKPPEIDPLKTAGSAMALQQGMLNNRLLGMKLQGQQALGQIIGQNTDPNTGEVDYAGASRDAASNPSAAILLPEFQAQALQRQLTQVQLQREQLGYSDDEWKRISGAVLPLIQKYGTPDKNGQMPQIDPATLTSELTTAAKDYGLLSDPKFVGRLADLSQNIAKGDTASNLNILKGLAIMGSPNAETVALVNGAPGIRNTGGQQVATQTSALTGQVTPMGGDAAVTNNTLSPESKAAPRGYVDAKGVTHQAPTSALVTDTGEPRANVAGITGSNGETNTSLAPGQAEALAQPVAARGQRAQQIEESAAGSAQRVANLDELKAALGGFRPGPGAAKTSAFVTEANRILGTNFAASDVGAQQAFDKLAEQVSAQQRDAMGLAATNAQTEMAHNASPNGQRSPEAIGRVWAQLRGNEDWINARNKAWKLYQEKGGTADHLNDFEQQFYQNFDPKMFQFQYMTPNQRGELARSMGPDAFKAWNAKRQQLLSLKGIQ